MHQRTNDDNTFSFGLLNCLHKKNKRCYKIIPIKFNVISISLGPLQTVTYTISEDVFTVVLVKSRVCYFCHFTTIIPNPVNV